MFTVLAMAAEQISALVFIGILIGAGVVVMGFTTNDILSPRRDLDKDQPPSYSGGGADTLYSGVVVILLIGVVGAVITGLVH